MRYQHIAPLSCPIVLPCEHEILYLITDCHQPPFSRYGILSCIYAIIRDDQLTDIYCLIEVLQSPEETSLLDYRTITHVPPLVVCPSYDIGIGIDS
jgi:hypothetical protein